MTGVGNITVLNTVLLTRNFGRRLHAAEFVCRLYGVTGVFRFTASHVFGLTNRLHVVFTLPCRITVGGFSRPLGCFCRVDRPPTLTGFRLRGHVDRLNGSLPRFVCRNIRFITWTGRPLRGLRRGREGFLRVQEEGVLVGRGPAVTLVRGDGLLGVAGGSLPRINRKLTHFFVVFC